MNVRLLTPVSDQHALHIHCSQETSQPSCPWKAGGDAGGLDGDAGGDGDTSAGTETFLPSLILI